MTDINTVTLSGEVSRAAQLAATSGGFPLAKFSLKVRRSFRGRDGASRERWSYIDCAIVGDQADRAARQIVQGAEVVVAGQIVQDSWKGADGSWQHATRVEARDFALLAAPPAGQAQAAQGGFTAAPPPPRPQQMQMQYGPPIRTMGPQTQAQAQRDEADVQDMLADNPF